MGFFSKIFKAPAKIIKGIAEGVGKAFKTIFSNPITSTIAIAAAAYYAPALISKLGVTAAAAAEGTTAATGGLMGAAAGYDASALAALTPAEVASGAGLTAAETAATTGGLVSGVANTAKSGYDASALAALTQEEVASGAGLSTATTGLDIHIPNAISSSLQGLKNAWGGLKPYEKFMVAGAGMKAAGGFMSGYMKNKAEKNKYKPTDYFQGNYPMYQYSWRGAQQNIPGQENTASLMPQEQDSGVSPMSGKQTELFFNSLNSTTEWLANRLEVDGVAAARLQKMQDKMTDPEYRRGFDTMAQLLISNSLEKFMINSKRELYGEDIGYMS